MNPALARTTVAHVIRTADALGATLPKRAMAEHAKLQALAEGASALAAERKADIGGAVVAALEAGHDPFTSAAVTAEVTRKTVMDTAHGISIAVTDRTAAFVDDHAVELLACFAEPFATAAEQIADAYRVLGDTDLDNTRAIGKLGGEAGRAWAEVQAAERTIAAILGTWKLLSQVAPHAVPWFPQYRPLAFADVPPSDWLEQRPPKDLTPWQAARNGWPLALATPEEYGQRIAAVNEALTAGRAEADNAFRDGWRRTHGLGHPVTIL